MNKTNDKDFYKEVVEQKGLTLVKFEAEWCSPCKALAPVLEDLSKEYENRIQFLKVDIDESQDTAQLYSVRSIPTLLLFKDGLIIERVVGVVGKAKMQELLDGVLEDGEE
jgi:thioredoxin 1